MGSHDFVAEAVQLKLLAMLGHACLIVVVAATGDDHVVDLENHAAKLCG